MPYIFDFEKDIFRWLLWLLITIIIFIIAAYLFQGHTKAQSTPAGQAMAKLAGNYYFWI